MNITIYHNPKCSKSRCGLEYLKAKGLEPTVVEYLKMPLSAQQLAVLLEKLNKRPIDIIRTGEESFAPYKGVSLTDEALIQLMVENPRLIERPIVETDDKAVVARPVENIDGLL